jgi:hypothetical protein
MIQRRHRLAAVVVVGSALALTAPAAAVQSSADGGSAGTDRSDAAAFHVAPKSGAGTRGSANPYTGLLPDLDGVDYKAWRQKLRQRADRRAGSPQLAEARREANRATPAAAAPVGYDEQEPAGSAGSNDTPESAEPIPGFGTGAGSSNAVRITGTKAQLPSPPLRRLAPGREDNGAISKATPTRLGRNAAVITKGVLGDGPHGGRGGSNDFDFYRVRLYPGQTLTVRTILPERRSVDTVIALYRASGGDPLVVNDDAAEDFSSRFDYRVSRGGVYYVLVAGYAEPDPLPSNPNRSGSGSGGAARGNYQVRIAQGTQDLDYYAVDLAAGDVLGGITKGRADSLTVFRPDGTQMVGSKQLDATGLYAPNSPLPGGGTTSVAYVAEEAGTYAIQVDGTTGGYTAQLEAYRPGAETDANQTQTVLLDFEGGRVNTAIWGGFGVSELSPFSAFVAKWGIPREREQALIDAITDQVEDNLEAEVAAGGLNPDLQVDVVNSRTNPELRGQENVSRVIVGGTIEESGIPTIGIAQYIDPGNYGHEDQALVLLDVLSGDDPDDPASLNSYLTSASDREAFVTQGVSNVTAHEIGHLVGSYHTDNQSPITNLMDAGGFNFDKLFGVGPDGVGGTEDDVDVEFTTDIYDTFEGFTGLENTQNVVAWAYPSGGLQ